MPNRIAEDAAHAIDAWVADHVRELIRVAAAKNTELVDNNAALSVELQNTRDQLEAVEEQNSRLKKERDERPSSPDQIVDLVRKDLEPMFADLHRMVEEMEPRSPERAASTQAQRESEPAA